MVSAAVGLRMDGDRIGQARIALGSVALKPWRARAAEDLLAGAAPTPETFAAAAEAALADARPSGDNAYKIELARRIVVRALTLAAAGTPDRVPALPASPFAPNPSASTLPPPALSPEPPPMPERQRHGASIGQPLTRRDGHAKITGAARYSADFKPEGLLHAVMAVSAVARGRVTHLDVAAAEAHPGVVAVMTPRNAPALAKSPDLKDNPFAFRLDLLQNDGVRYANQPIAVVIAETLEAATEGAALLAPRYESEPVSVALGAGEVFRPRPSGPARPPTKARATSPPGMAAAETRIEATYDTAAQYHNALEPHASVAAWDGDRLTLHTPTQALWIAKGRLAGLFGIPPENIHVVCHYLGGGFGSKGFIAAPQILGIMAAKLVGRPVKLVTRREQMFGPVGHRAATRQTLKLGAARDGTLTALDHHTLTLTSRHDDFVEPSGILSRHLYAAGAIATTHAVSRADIGTPIFMRAPGEASGSVAVESALDELALELDLDPLEIRLRNYAEVEPITHRPFSSKALRECYAQGATRFGWASRPRQPRQMRDADGLLVGWGLGTATYPAGMMQGEARATIRADGTGADRDRRPGHGPGRLDGAGADRRRRARPPDRPGSSCASAIRTCRTAAWPAAPPAPPPAAPRSTTPPQAAIAALADLAVDDRASPLYGAGNAGVTAARRAPRPPRRPRPLRSLRRDPGPRRQGPPSRPRARARATRPRERPTRCTRTGRSTRR